MVDNVLNRKMFMGGVSPDEYKDLLELSGQYGNQPTVNKSFTAQDVLRSVGPLSQPVAEGAVNTVAQFNQFLAGILGNKFARIDEEEQAVKDADTAAQQRVDTFLANQKQEEPLVVNDQIVYPSTLGSDEEKIFDFRDEPKKSFDNIKVVNNQVYDIEKDEVLADLREDTDEDSRFLPFGDFFLDLDKLKENPKDVEGALVDAKKDSVSAPSNAARVGQLELLKKTYEEDNLPFPVDLQAELDYLTKPDPKPYVPPYETNFVDLVFTKNKSAEAAESQYATLLEAEQLFADPNFVTGTGTNALLPVQKFFEDIIGLDIKEIFDGVNLKILNDPGDTESLNKQTTRLTLNILGTGKLPGAISDFEFRQMMNSVFNSSTTEEANIRFIAGMKYLYNKEMAQADIIAKIDQTDPKALVLYREAMRNWDEENRPKYLPSSTYIDEILDRAPQSPEV